MEHFFVSSVETPLKNWCDAFSLGAERLLSHPPSVLQKGGEYWLDWASFPEALAKEVLDRLLNQGARVVVMSAHIDAGQALGLLARGVRGYCYRFAAPAQLREIASVVGGGGLWLGGEAMQRFLKNSLALTRSVDQVGMIRRDSLPVAVTDREWAVAGEVARGANNREIAAALNISERTVKAHLTTVFEKLQLRDRVQLALLLNNVLPGQW